jgi:hypothetical protein
VDVDFDGIVIPDHIPGLGGTPRGAAPAQSSSRGYQYPGRPDFLGRPAQSPGLSPGLAYSIGYLNATLKAALSNRRKA